MAKCNRTHGFTLVELLVATSVLVSVVATSVMMYAFVIRQSGHASTQAALQLSGIQAMEKLATAIEPGVEAESVVLLPSGRSVLRITLPNNSDVLGNYIPASVNKRGYEKHALGKRLWIYTSDSSGDLQKSGTILWRAITSTDIAPSTGDSSWSLYFGTTRGRIGNVASFSYEIDEVNFVTISMTLTDNPQATVLGGNGTYGNADVVKFERSIYLRNWRQ